MAFSDLQLRFAELSCFAQNFRRKGQSSFFLSDCSLVGGGEVDSPALTQAREVFRSDEPDHMADGLPTWPGGENPIFAALPPAERAAEGPFLARPDYDNQFGDSMLGFWQNGSFDYKKQTIATWAVTAS